LVEVTVVVELVLAEIAAVKRAEVVPVELEHVPEHWFVLDWHRRYLDVQLILRTLEETATADPDRPCLGMLGPE